jgi:hypothetical protein
MSKARKAVTACLGYLKRHPFELLHVARKAAGLRISVPLDALRWMVDQIPPGKRAPKDVVLGEKPPAITFGATLNLMGTEVRAGAALRIEEILVSPAELRVTVRLADVRLEALGGGDSPLAALLKSGALDLSKPGNLANFMPQRPPALIEAKDDRLVVDLMKVPKIAANERLRRILSVVTPVLAIRDVRVEDDHLQIGWKVRPTGVPTALFALRAAASPA